MDELLVAKSIDLPWTESSKLANSWFGVNTKASIWQNLANRLTFDHHLVANWMFCPANSATCLANVANLPGKRGKPGKFARLHGH